MNAQPEDSEQDHFDRLYAVMNDMVEDGYSDKAILAELSDEDPDYLNDLIVAVREAQ